MFPSPVRGGTPLGREGGNPNKKNLGREGPTLASFCLTLASSWRHLGSSWRLLGLILAYPGSSWRHLGVILTHFGVVLFHLGVSWQILAHLGPSWPKKLVSVNLREYLSSSMHAPGGLLMCSFSGSFPVENRPSQETGTYRGTPSPHRSLVTCGNFGLVTKERPVDTTRERRGRGRLALGLEQYRGTSSPSRN